MDIVCFSSVVKWDFPVHLQSAIKMQPILGTLRQAVSQRWFLLDSAEVWSLNCWRILSQLPAAASCWDPWVLDKKNHKVRQESCLFQHLTYEHSSNYDWIYSWMLSWETHGLYNQMHLLPARLKSSMMWCGCLRIFFPGILGSIQPSLLVTAETQALWTWVLGRIQFSVCFPHVAGASVYQHCNDELQIFLFAAFINNDNSNQFIVLMTSRIIFKLIFIR